MQICLVCRSTVPHTYQRQAHGRFGSLNPDISRAFPVQRALLPSCCRLSSTRLSARLRKLACAGLPENKIASLGVDSVSLFIGRLSRRNSSPCKDLQTNPENAREISGLTTPQRHHDLRAGQPQRSDRSARDDWTPLQTVKLCNILTNIGQDSRGFSGLRK